MFTIFISNKMANELNVSLSTIYSAPKGTRLLQYSRKWQLYAKLLLKMERKKEKYFLGSILY